MRGSLAPNVSLENGRFVRKNAKGEKWTPKLRDAVETMEKWATIVIGSHRGRDFLGFQPEMLGEGLETMGDSASLRPQQEPRVGGEQQLPARNLGRLNMHGKLNPNWVEQLMGLHQGTRYSRRNGYASSPT